MLINSKMITTVHTIASVHLTLFSRKVEVVIHLLTSTVAKNIVRSIEYHYHVYQLK